MAGTLRTRSDEYLKKREPWIFSTLPWTFHGIEGGDSNPHGFPHPPLEMAYLRMPAIIFPRREFHPYRLFL